MGLPNEIHPLQLCASSGAYQINQSLRFDGSAYLNRTPASAGNRRVYTISLWFKRGKLGETGKDQGLLTAVSSSGSNNEDGLFLVETNQIRFWINNGNDGDLLTSQLVRDPSAWYHIVAAIDTTQSTSSSRVKLYLNGVQITQFDYAVYPSQNYDSKINNTVPHTLGFVDDGGGSGDYFNGYLAEVNFIDGTALTPSSFGETDTITGAWIPKKYSGIYGTNGFYLKYESSGIGTDSSGNGNNWTANNFAEEYSSVNYASNWIGSTSGTPYSGSWENVFNGNITVYADFVYAYNNTITLTFSTPLTGTIEVYGSDGGDGAFNSGYIGLSDSSQWSINSVARASAYWYSFGSKTNITSITVSSPGGNGAILGAIRVNGQLLANNSAKATYDNFDDTPTNNYATLNPLDTLNGRWSNSPTNGNLEISIPSDAVTKRNYPGMYGTVEVPVTGKWYFEVAPSQQYTDIGVVGSDYSLTVTGGNDLGTANKKSVTYKCFDGNYGWNGSTTSSGLGGFTAGNVYGVAIDLQNETFRVYENGVAGNELSISGWAGGVARVSAWVSASSETGTLTFNFGQRSFSYTPPSNFKALCTANLPEPTIKKGGAHFNTVLYTGTGSSLAVTGVGFQPDFIWFKNRSNAASHSLVNQVTDAYLASDLTDAESAATDLTYQSDGFTHTASSSRRNTSSQTYVAWNWKANGAGSSNTAGSITSTVSANATAGFSIVTYTSPNSASDQTVGHGLGVKPSFIIVKNRDLTYNWDIYHASLGYNASLIFTTASTRSGAFGAEPTSTVFTTKTGYTHNSTNTYVAYCFSEVAGYSKFGSYTGNGTTTGDGPFVFCGFKPSLIVLKSSSAVDNWRMYDDKRLGYNSSNSVLYPNLSNTEGASTDHVDILSNGFKLRSDNNNSSGVTYIFMAFASTPFKYSTAR